MRTDSRPNVALPVPMHPKRRDLLKLGVLGLLASAGLPGCGGDTDVQTTMRKLLTQRWQDRYGSTPGGLSLAMITPVGEYFASSIAGATANSHFRAASTTKTFTAAAIMLLDQRGLLRIDDMITAAMPGRAEPYLPDTPAFAIPYKNQISIRQLLSHRAGVFDVTNQAVPSSSNALYAGQQFHYWKEDRDPTYSFTKDELIEVLAVNQLSYAAPGTGYHYSDSHYQLLGKIVERVSGLSLNAFKTQELLQPNRLTQSHFVVDGADQQLPSPYIDGFTQYQGQTYPFSAYNYSYDPGSGNLVTTPADLSRWVRCLIKGETRLDATQVARMCDVLTDSHYGLGIQQWTCEGRDLGYGHNGGTAGYLTNAYHNPDTDISFVMQCALLDYDNDPNPLTSLTQQANWLGGIVNDMHHLLGY